MLVVETLLADNAGEGLFAYLDVYLSAKGSTGGIDEGHADTLVGRDGMIARSDLANRLAVLQHGIAMTGNGLVLQLDAY